MSIRTFSFMTVVLWASAHSLAGSVIYSNISPSFPGDLPGAAILNSVFTEVTFTATGGGPLADVVFDVTNGSAQPLPLTAALYTNSAGSPGTLLESWTFPAPGVGETTLTSVVHPVLTPSTQYWFVLDDKSAAQYAWYLNDTNVLGGDYVGSALTGTQNVGNTMPGLQLDGPASTPEPATWTLCGLALFGLVVRARKR